MRTLVPDRHKIIHTRTRSRTQAPGTEVSNWTGVGSYWTRTKRDNSNEKVGWVVTSDKNSKSGHFTPDGERWSREAPTDDQTDGFGEIDQTRIPKRTGGDDWPYHEDNNEGCEETRIPLLPDRRQLHERSIKRGRDTKGVVEGSNVVCVTA